MKFLMESSIAGSDVKFQKSKVDTKKTKFSPFRHAESKI
jgi:hypothetical protein